MKMMASKEIPILFSTPMVEAILSGKKTMTRRIIKKDLLIQKDKYRVGDILWVRESWRLVNWNFEDGEMSIEYKDGKTVRCIFHDPGEDSMWVQDRVEHLEKIGCLKQDPKDEERLVGTGKQIPWKPSIHQPKEASRIWLKIKSVKVESLQDISDGDVAREGVTWNEPLQIGRDDRNCKSPAQRAFRALWDKINGVESWDKNPFVWAIEFKVLSKKGKP